MKYLVCVQMHVHYYCHKSREPATEWTQSWLAIYGKSWVSNMHMFPFCFALLSFRNKWFSVIQIWRDDLSGKIFFSHPKKVYGSYIFHSPKRITVQYVSWVIYHFYQWLIKEFTLLAFYWQNCESPKYLREEYSRWIKTFHFVKSCKFKIHIATFTLTVVKIEIFSKGTFIGKIPNFRLFELVATIC